MEAHLLHICNDFSWTRVHINLYTELDRLGLKQTIFNPLRNEKDKGNSKINFITSGSSVVYSGLLKKYHRYLFKRKIEFLYSNLKQKIDLSKITLTHASTLFSDGAVAFKLYKEHNIPYIVTIRNTDLNLYFRYMVFLRELGLSILKNAKQIIFISPSYKRKLFHFSFLQTHEKELAGKSAVIPNGIDDFWLKNVQKKKGTLEDKVHLLYIGNFSKGKNVKKLVHAVNLLNKTNDSFFLNLVGEGGRDFVPVMKLIKGNNNFKYHGKIIDKNRLRQLFSEIDIFTMPSKHETFGLVYIEALSQGIPVLFTINEGIDGYYDKNIGEAVNCNSVNDIACGIKKIADRYTSYNFDPASIVANHNWKTIAEKYISLYKTVSNQPIPGNFHRHT